VSVDDEVSLGSAARGPRQLQYELEMARLRDREAERKDREAHQRKAEHDKIEREWEIEQQRIALLGAQANANHNGNHDMSGIRSLLPKMVEGDAQTFFSVVRKGLAAKWHRPINVGKIASSAVVTKGAENILTNKP